MVHLLTSHVPSLWDALKTMGALEYRSGGKLSLSPLALCVRRGDPTCVSWLLRQKAWDLGERVGGDPLLHIVVKDGVHGSRDALPLLTLLLHHGADPLDKNAQGKTALEVAQLVRWKIKYGNPFLDESDYYERSDWDKIIYVPDDISAMECDSSSSNDSDDEGYDLWAEVEEKAGFTPMTKAFARIYGYESAGIADAMISLLEAAMPGTRYPRSHDFKDQRPSEDLSLLLEMPGSNHDLFRIRIMVDGEEVYCCHKWVLFERWEYFRTCMSNDMREANTGTLNLEGESPEVVKWLIKSIYKNTAARLPDPSPDCKIVDFLMAADKYLMPKLFEGGYLEACAISDLEACAADSVNMEMIEDLAGRHKALSKLKSHCKRHKKRQRVQKRKLEETSCRL